MANLTPEEISEILAQFFDVTGKRQYIGARYVPIFGRKDETSIAWDNTKPYEPLTIVLYQGNSYTSRTYVPAGVAITDGQYWANTGNYNAQVETYRQEVLGFDERIDALEDYATVLNDTVPRKVFYFDDVESMSEYQRLSAGDVCYVKSRKCHFTMGTSLVANGMDIISCENDLFASMIVVDNTVSLSALGATAGSTVDVATYVTRAFSIADNVIFDNDYYLLSTIDVPTGKTLDFKSDYLHLDCGGNDAFVLDTVHNITVNGNNCIIVGTCKTVFAMKGTNDFTISPSNYAHAIRIDSVHASGENIVNFITMTTAVRQLYLTRCIAWTNNGIIVNGKCIEIMISDSILFTNTSGSVSYAIKLESNLGGGLYCEGWTIENCTLDCEDKVNGITALIQDIYAFQLDNCYIGTPIQFMKPTTTTHTRNIVINNCVINGHGRAGIQFSSTTDYLFHANITGCNCSSYIQIANHSFDVNIKGCVFDGSGNVAVLLGGSVRATIDGLSVNENYANAVVWNNGNFVDSDVMVTNILYKGSGSAVTPSDVIRTSNVGQNLASNRVAHITQGVHAENSTLATQTISFPKGQQGLAIVKLEVSSFTQGATLTVSLPSAFSVPNGSGWNGKYIEILSEGAIYTAIPFFCTANVQSGTFAVTTDKEISVDYHGYIALMKV